MRAASEVLGGPLGRRAAPVTSRGRRAGWSGWSAAPLLVLGATAALVLSVLTRSHCRATGWASPDQFAHACYSDVPTLVATGGGASSPPGTALLLRALAALAPSPVGAFDASVLLLAVALPVAVVCAVRAAGRRPWDAALLALSPVLVTSGVVGVDLVAVALLSGAVLAWARERSLLVGILAGLAASVRPVALLVAVAAVLLCAGAGRVRHAVLTGAGALAAVAGTTALAAVTAPAGAAPSAALTSWTAETTTGAGYGSLWLLASLVGQPLGARTVTLLWALGTAAVLAGVSARVLRRGPSPSSSPLPQRPLPAVALALVGGALLVSPAVPVQATLVVLPLAALAVPRWSAHLPWAAAEVLYATVTWLYLYGGSQPERGAPAWLYGALLLLRLVALASLAGRPLWRPLWTSGAEGSAAPVVLTRSGRRPTRSAAPGRRTSPPVTERP